MVTAYRFMKEFSKTYDPKKYEDDIYKKWEESHYFGPEKCLQIGLADPEKPYFSIVLPPPNVTGKLHAGHAAMLAIEDTMVRFARMQGRPTLWIPGTDHAAIATQAKVEKIIFEKTGKTRQDLGREKLLKEIEKFAKESHDNIVWQTKKMGSSLDWKREAYTLDQQRNHAVNVAFKRMFDDGLVINKERVVNWCPKCLSTLSDEEVEYREQKTKLYTFKYDPAFPFEISTTRPETKLGDSAVAVNPKDKRYAKHIGKTLEADFCGTKLFLKIIGSADVETDFGTGALGVTPAHSMIDWQLAQKEDLPLIKVIAENGVIAAGFGDYSGKKASEARKMIVEKLRSEELLSKEDEIVNNLSICYRCGTAIEPLPSSQWFVDVHKKFKHGWFEKEVSLRQLLRHAVESKKIEIIPKKFEKTYYHWIDNLRDWCISRQIWFGHRIPVWYKNDRIHCGEKPPREEGWEQDQDTLDTWFSSGLWTFSAMGWPKKSEDLEKFHPTTILETGYDILFFWVARMILMTTYLLEEIPFEKVYLHGLVRDENGRKMSKSLGNVIDPIDEIEKYGADAFRLSLMLGISPGQDLKLSEEKIKNYRNFTNKLWNISRYVMQKASPSEGFGEVRAEELTPADSWILSKTSQAIQEITDDLENYRLSLAGEKLEKFTWDELADWYVETSKLETNQEIKRVILGNIFSDLLKLWHPFMPFITEYVWSESGQNDLIMVQKWPKTEKYERLLAGAPFGPDDFELTIKIVSEIRNARMENRIGADKKFDLTLEIDEENPEKILYVIKLQENAIVGLRTGVKKIEIGNRLADNFIQRNVGNIKLYIPLDGLVDTEKEKERALKEIAQLEKFVLGLEQRLSDKNFVQKAPDSVIMGQAHSLEDAKNKLDSLKKRLGDLK